MVTAAYYFLPVAVVADSLVVDALLRNDTLNFCAHVLDRAAKAEVIGTARLPAAVALTLNHLATVAVRVTRVLLLLHRLVHVHLSLDMVVAVRVKA